MAVSTCTKCGAVAFEVVKYSPKGSSVKVMLVQCAACGGVVSAMDVDVPAMVLAKHATVLKEIAQFLKISSIDWTFLELETAKARP